MTYPKVILKQGKESSMMRRHPWVFSGAIAAIEGDINEGDVVAVYDAEDRYLGAGHCQNSSIAVCILTFDQESIDDAFWLKRLEQAWKYRETAGVLLQNRTGAFRLIHGEGDNLSGLIVDVYNSTAVMQAHTAGIYLERKAIARAIVDSSKGRITAVYNKSSGTVPYKADLDAVDEYLIGESGPATIEENGLKFLIDWEAGQKTGFYVDQRENRKLLQQYSQGRKVLNTFCYTGGFSVNALHAGASLVHSVDSSKHAIELTNKNIALNFEDTVPHQSTISDTVRFLDKMEETYDLIILDPPAYAKHQKVLNKALYGYKKLNALAFKKIAPGGILFTFSCSQAVSRQDFRKAVFAAAANSGRHVRILHQLSQPADHPVSIYHPEGEYLKGLVLYVE